MTDRIVALLAAIADASDDQERAHLLRKAARSLLSQPTAMAEVAKAALDPEDSASAQAAVTLLSCALDEARMAVENDTPEGDALIAAVATTLMAQDAACPIAPVLRLRLAQAYARAGLPPPPFTILTPEVMAGAVPPGEKLPDLGELLDPILRDLGDTPLQAHAAVSELLAGLPSEPAAMLVSMIIARPGVVEARLGLYWLLDQRVEIRLAAATALLARAEAGMLPSELAALFPAIRKWLPDGPARAALDAVIRRQMRDGGMQGQVSAATIHRAAASLPDGAGAQSLIAAFQQGSRRGIAMAMLKQGHGVKDAFVIPCASASEQKRKLAGILDEIETFDIPPAALADGLARGLGEGLALNLLCAPGLVEWAELLGSDALTPAAGDAKAILMAIGVTDALPPSSRAALVKASADWMDRFDQSDAWFEDTADLRAAIARARTEKGQEAAVWKHLETRREWWARLFAVSAATLKAAGEREFWASFAAVAQGLLDGSSLKRIPVMADIVNMTLEAFDAREGNTPSLTAPGEIGALLAHAGITEAYLQGYLVALAVAPREPSPEAWLGPLLGGIEFPGEGAVNQLLGFVTIQAELASDGASDAKIVVEWLSSLDVKGIHDWATGFHDLMSACPRSWPGKSLAADDKRVLREIKDVAKGGNGAALRTVLPSWIARRHALSQ